MPNNKPVPTTHFRAFVSSGSLYLTGSSPDAIELLSAAFPDAAWPRDEDGKPYCDTGIPARCTEVIFDDEEPRTARPRKGHGPCWQPPTLAPDTNESPLDREIAAKKEFLGLFASKDAAEKFELIQGWIADGQTGLPYWLSLIQRYRTIAESGREV